LLEVTKEVTSETIPSEANSNSKTNEAGNRSDSRPAKSRHAAKQSEYDVMIWRQIHLWLTGTAHPDQLRYSQLDVEANLRNGH
jgi:hypothetical protein